MLVSRLCLHTSLQEDGCTGDQKSSPVSSPGVTCGQKVSLPVANLFGATRGQIPALQTRRKKVLRFSEKMLWKTRMKKVSAQNQMSVLVAQIPVHVAQDQMSVLAAQIPVQETG